MDGDVIQLPTSNSLSQSDYVPIYNIGTWTLFFSIYLRAYLEGTPGEVDVI